MARALVDSGAVELGIIATAPASEFTRRDYCQVQQWIVPGETPLGGNGLPSVSVLQAIVAAAKEFSPDLVHIWGTEAFWGLLSARHLLKYPALLEIQGLKGEIAKVFHGDLTSSEQWRSIGIKEVLKRRTMRADRRAFARWGLREEEMIRGCRFVDVQSSWVASHIVAINPVARLFPVDLLLRAPFYEADGWRPPGRPTLFCSASYTSPFKGLHVAIRALAVLRKRIPDARLRIAGAHQRPGIRQDGYMRWVNRTIRQLGLTDAVEWLGPLDAEQIVAELKNAAAVVIPTFIENCCTAMQEAMAIGTPVVVSYAGGIPCIGKDEESCLFFPPGDEAMCAYQLERVLTDESLALGLSQESRKTAAVRNDRRRIVQRQLDIYHQIVDDGERG
jgi:glycosyltransferase involved in cell wall biosynthesis